MKFKNFVNEIQNFNIIDISKLEKLKTKGDYTSIYKFGKNIVKVTKEPANIDFLLYCMRNNNLFLPGVYNMKKLDNKTYIFEVEKLYKLKGKNFKDLNSLAINLDLYSSWGDKKSKINALKKLLIGDNGYSQNVKDICLYWIKIMNSVGKNYRFDFHEGNVMQRKNGDLVINDPFN